MNPILYYDNHRRLMFGKYEGEPLWDIIKKDPQYIRYCIEKFENFKLSDTERCYLDRQLPDMLEWKDGNKVFSKGEYKGRTLWSVIGSNPKYVYWCLDNVDGFVLSDKEENFLVRCYHKQEYERSRRISNAIYWRNWRSHNYNYHSGGYGCGDRNLYG